MEVLLCVVFIIAMAVIMIYAVQAMKKQKGVFSQYLNSGEEEERKGNDHLAIPMYKHALAIILGVEQGSVDLTAKGILMLMEQDGKMAVEKLNAVYARNGIQYSWAEFNAIIAEVQKLTANPDLVDRNGLAKGAGKDLFAALKDRLVQCIHSMPEIGAPAATPVNPAQMTEATPPPVPAQATAVMPPITFSQPIPSTDSYAAKNAIAKKRNRLILWSVIGALGLCVLVLCIGFFLFIYGTYSTGVTNNILNTIATP